jgi:hypothetical protein
MRVKMIATKPPSLSDTAITAACQTWYRAQRVSGAQRHAAMRAALEAALSSQPPITDYELASILGASYGPIDEIAARRLAVLYARLTGGTFDKAAWLKTRGANADLLGKLDALSSQPPTPEVGSSPDDIRAAGWVVAAHNDYRQDGQAHTFWLFTKGHRNVKGEGLTDAEALNQIRAQLRTTEGTLEAEAP